MKTIPRIGSRVKWSGRWGRGQTFVGTVYHIYHALDPAPGCDEEDDDCRYVEAPFTPERWQAGVALDYPLPPDWPYTGTNKFCPAISELEPAT